MRLSKLSVLACACALLCLAGCMKSVSDAERGDEPASAPKPAPVLHPPVAETSFEADLADVHRRFEVAYARGPGGQDAALASWDQAYCAYMIDHPHFEQWAGTVTGLPSDVSPDLVVDIGRQFTLAGNVFEGIAQDDPRRDFIAKIKVGDKVYVSGNLPIRGSTDCVVLPDLPLSSDRLGDVQFAVQFTQLRDLSMEGVQPDPIAVAAGLTNATP